MSLEGWGREELFDPGGNHYSSTTYFTLITLRGVIRVLYWIMYENALDTCTKRVLERTTGKKYRSNSIIIILHVNPKTYKPH